MEWHELAPDNWEFDPIRYRHVEQRQCTVVEDAEFCELFAVPGHACLDEESVRLCFAVFLKGRKFGREEGKTEAMREIRGKLRQLKIAIGGTFL